MDVTAPWREAPAAIEPALFATIRRQAIFECCKWDPQVEDVATLAPFPLVLRRAAWRELAALAEALAAETLAAETELGCRLELHKELGLPRPIRRALRRAASRGKSRGAARVMRFDFHATPDGWRISEVNSDAPGGFNEASGFTRLMAPHVPGAEPAGDPAGRLAEAIAAAVAPGSTVGLVHATAYTDDRQVMVFLAREIEARGLRAILTGPDHLRWQDSRASLASDAFAGPLDFLVRFFPGEWLPNLPRTCGWKHFFYRSETPASNPGYALLTQSKRFPLVWDRLVTELPDLAQAPARDVRSAAGRLAPGRLVGAQAGAGPGRRPDRPRRRHGGEGMEGDPPGRAPVPAAVGGAAAFRGGAPPDARGVALSLRGGLYHRRPRRRRLWTRGAPAADRSPGAGHGCSDRIGGM